MATIFDWQGTYDDTTADSGETIAGNGLSAGGGDGGEDTTLFESGNDYMQITSLAAAGGILQQSSDDVHNLNQGTIYIRFFVDDNTTGDQFLFGWYTAGSEDYFYVQYSYISGNGRMRLWIRDNASSNAHNAYLTWTPVNSTFYDLRITWDMDTDDSVYFSIDGGAWSRTTQSGAISDIVISEMENTLLYIGARNQYGLNFAGEISKFMISDTYQDITLGADAGITIPVVVHHLKQQGIS